MNCIFQWLLWQMRPLRCNRNRFPALQLVVLWSGHVAVLFAVAMFQNMMFDVPSPLMPWHRCCTPTIKVLTVGRGPKQPFALINKSAHRVASDFRHFQIFTPFAQNISRFIMTTWTLCSSPLPTGATRAASSCLCNVALTCSAIQPAL